MKPPLLPLFLMCMLVATKSFAEGAVVVSIAPTKLTLHATTPQDRGSSQLLTLSVANGTDRNWRFFRFYEGWRPILYNAKREAIEFSFARAATLPVRATDYPLLKPGQWATAKRACGVIRSENGLGFLMSDGTGGQFSALVAPGDYQLCIFYRAFPGDEPLFNLATQRFGINKSEIWQGWAMSNWIAISIRKERQ